MSQAQTRERILQVATRLFKERGFANVSVREICHAANASLPMVYYYFKDKRGLFEAVTREQVTLAPLLAELAEIQKGRQPIVQKMAQFIEKYLDSFPKDLLNAGLYMREKTDFDRSSMLRFSGDLNRAHELLTSLICDGMAAGELRVTDAAKAADCVLGMMHRVISQQAHFNRMYDRHETGAYILEFALHALKAAP